ncbi:hypothetical protein BDBG_16231 [Blastomyces gilchristii SLH14081]|uniref:Uncharacterized protein n=1 Tax=Blastomyces gilchristii (strain SLH14081) TaxID=559298 RepID=A0A179UBF1_BLAGS|nr:uncharacterized protein BDBG_16231 [Blastomyces gilchristii SLH14081]OAT04341.1 hypothetical protein BDBG_16231 [Blastomyces gilchristii SLH14081]
MECTVHASNCYDPGGRSRCTLLVNAHIYIHAICPYDTCFACALGTHVHWPGKQGVIIISPFFLVTHLFRFVSFRLLCSSRNHLACSVSRKATFDHALTRKCSFWAKQTYKGSKRR